MSWVITPNFIPIAWIGQEIQHFKVGISYTFSLRGVKAAPFGQPPKLCSFHNVISYDLCLLSIWNLNRLLLVFTTTSYKRIESYLFKILDFEHVKISWISGFPKKGTVAHCHRNVWENCKLWGSITYDPYMVSFWNLPHQHKILLPTN